MKARPFTLSHPELRWSEGVPSAADFDDIYYNSEDGLNESRFVFLDGVGLSQALKDTPRLVIGETGFGTGLNFLLTWQAWRASKCEGPLTFISTEAFPLSRTQMKRAHASFPSLESLAAQLRNQLPPPSRGFHLRIFDDGRVRLILLQGDAAEQLAGLEGQVDLWYLDGFVPSKNQSLWSDSVFDQIARLSAPNARLATFTAAGLVKRALAQRGFDVSKAPGFGRKRERILATYKCDEHVSRNTGTDAALRRWLPQAVQQSSTGSVCVIGGGIAGRLTAAALADRGVDVDLFAADSEPPASAVPAAILAPRFLLDDQPSSDFLSAAYSFAVSSQRLAPYWGQPRGLALYPATGADKRRQDQIRDQLTWGPEWIEDRGDYLFLPESGSLDAAACLASLPTPTPADIRSLRKTSDGWMVQEHSGIARGPFKHVLLAAGPATQTLLSDPWFDLTPRHGSTFRAATGWTGLGQTRPETLSKGATKSANINGHHWFGSSFSDTPEEESTARQSVADKIKGMSLHAAPDLSVGWSGVRATTTDRFPYAGALTQKDDFMRAVAPLAVDANRDFAYPVPPQNGLYCLTGLGSKGWQFAPLLAEMIAAQITGDVIPVSLDVQRVLSPLRSAVRAVIKRHS